MLIIPPPEFRKHRKTARSTQPTPPPAQPLTLVSAVYNDDADPILTLGFDRAIDLSGLVPTAIVVDEAEFSYLLYDASGGAVLIDPQTVQLTLVSIGDATGSGEHLTAAANNGIVAADDGGAWAGVNGLELPFP